jgi:hypothetical protein
MKEPQLTYSQLRQILSLVLTNGKLRVKLEDFLSGKLTKVNEIELLDMIQDSEADKDLIRILSHDEPDDMDATEALEYIAAFFAYIRASKEKCSSWLAGLGYAVQKQPITTKSGSKCS